MDFTVNIRNIGKLSDKTVQIRDFTVFAGTNNTGKSFVSKLLYSLFNVMNANHVEVYLNNLLEPAEHQCDLLKEWCDEYHGGQWEDIIPAYFRYSINMLVDRIATILPSDAIKKLRIASREYGEFFDEEEVMATVPLFLNEITQHIQAIKTEVDTFITQHNYLPLGPLVEHLRELQETTNGLIPTVQTLVEARKKIQEGTIETLRAGGMEHEFRWNLIGNFQIPNLADLRRREDAPAHVQIEGYGAVELNNGQVQFTVRKNWFQEVGRYSDALYLESPLYWKLRGALETLRFGRFRYMISRRPGGRRALSGVPEYFYNLVQKLRDEYIGEMAFPKIYEQLVGEDGIRGKIILTDNGELLFQEAVEGVDRSFSLHSTATGVTNIGMLALLIERKVLDTDTVIFIDEPEAHLHPEWQVVMAKALFELARQGASVVIATHSIDILKWLEVHVKKNPEDKKLVALNHFSPLLDKGEEEKEEDDFETKIEKIKEELTKPFSDLYLKGL